MAAPKPGDFITASCGRCNDVTGHVVMLVLDGRVARVECKACGSAHKYREARLPEPGGKERAAARPARAGGDREPSGAPGATPKRSAGSGGASRKSTAAARRESTWQEAMVRHNAETPLPYAMGNRYSPRDFLDHPVFGRGEVIAVIPPDKMEVLFQEGVKILRCRA